MQEQTVSRSIRTRSPSLGLMAGLLLALSVSASAELITVDAGTDGTGAASQCELRDAIVAANTDTAVDGCVAGNGADEIHFSQAGTVTLSAELPTIEQDLELVGLGPSETTVNGVGLYRQITAGSFITVRVADLTLRDGMNAVDAGCLLTDAASLTVEDVWFESCETSGDGGAALLNDGTVTFRRCLFVDNTATGSGGAIVVTSDTATIEDSTFAGNAAGASAGVLSIGSTQTTVRRTTFEDNMSVSDGGAIRIFNPSGLLVIEHSTFTGNRSTAAAGGALVQASGTVTLRNTIMAGNFAASAGAADLFKTSTTTMTSHGANLIGDNGTPDVAAVFPEGVNANGDIVGTTVAPIDPMLGFLGNNGGPLPTLLPLVGSLAIDQGACAGEVSDQRGFGSFATGLRVVDDLSVANQADGCDIGAVEVGASDAFFADGFETGDALQWSSTTP